MVRCPTPLNQPQTQMAHPLRTLRRLPCSVSFREYNEISPPGEETEGEDWNSSYSRQGESSKPSKGKTWLSFLHRRWLLRVEMVTESERTHTEDPGDGCHPPAQGLNSHAIPARDATFPRLPADLLPMLRSEGILKQCSMLVATPCANHAQGVVMRRSAATPATQPRLGVDMTFTSVVTVPRGARAARLFRRGEALVCQGSQNSCTLESYSGTAMNSLTSC